MKWLLACIVLGLACLVALVVAWAHYDMQQEAHTEILEMARDLKELETGGRGATFQERHDTLTRIYNKNLAARSSHARGLLVGALAVVVLASGSAYSALKYRKTRALRR